MALAVHPLADEWTEEYAVYVVTNTFAAYSRPLRHFFASCRAEQRRPVLLTNTDTVLSPQLYTAMSEAGAGWAFRDQGAVFNARTGAGLGAFLDLWREGSPRPPHEAVTFRDPEVPTLLFDLYAGDRADDTTSVGPLAQHMVRSLGGAPLLRTGLDEPLATRWDVGALTSWAQANMPATDPMLAGNDAGDWSSVTVARTRDGLVERVRGGVVLEQLATQPAAQWRDISMPSIVDALSGAVDRFQPIVGLVSAGMLRRVEDRYGYRVGAQPVDAPLAVLLGPRAVRQLQIDIADLSSRHDVSVFGPGRVPSVVVKMSGGEPVWTQLRAFMFDLDQERLAALLATEMKWWLP